jgi:hypothetical protein
MSIDLSQLDDKYGDILREYCRLGLQKELTEADTERLTQILTLAESNKELTLLFNEADHFLAHELGLLDIDDRSRYEQQQAKLRAKLGSQPVETKRPNPLPNKQRVFCSEILQRSWMIHYCLRSPALLE